MVFIFSVIRRLLPIHCKEKQWECKKCELSPCQQKINLDKMINKMASWRFLKKLSDCSGITSVISMVINGKHGILEVPEPTDCSGITSVNKKSRQVNPVAVSSKYFCERHVSDHNLRSRRIEESQIKKNRKEDLDERGTGPGPEFWTCAHYRPNLWEVEVEERSMGCEERTEEEFRLGGEDKWWQDSSAVRVTPQATFQDLDFLPG
ncbi:hypothetical protein T02_1825 [Trichinella nativa]|uniref:Uncharacterized protein n=1 Tax=Trichinella nativa TaxID=6335 RepID=A0A0V1KJI5_9BILA|nr:hypothetical protein T02_1825 [Trichinella nativa]